MKKILLVEDDEFLNQLYSTLLTKEGYSVESLMNGKEALTTIEKGGWDLVLLDVVLPGMDGFEVLASLQKKPSCPLIFMTNLDGSEKDKEQLSQADGYWIKSNMTPPEFLDKVKKILAG